MVNKVSDFMNKLLRKARGMAVTAPAEGKVSSDEALKMPSRFMNNFIYSKVKKAGSMNIDDFLSGKVKKP